MQAGGFLKVIFGKSLDSRQGPLIGDHFAEPTVGLLGLLGILELRLGLSAPAVSRAQRVTAYLGRLNACDDGERFYSQSLIADNVGVASELLRWRDLWRLEGWNGTAAADAPDRIVQMAEVEACSHLPVPPGEAERLMAITSLLEQGKACPVETLVLLDDIAHLPKALRDLIARLPIVLAWQPEVTANSASNDLSRLQRSVISAVVSNVVERIELANDGSVQFLRARDPSLAAEWLAHEHPKPDRRQLVLCENGGTLLDQSFRASAQPALGFDEASGLRPSLQVLTLALEMLWAPVDARKVLELLLNPFSPLPGRLSRGFARAYAEQPGSGASSWKALKAKVAAGEGGADSIKTLEFWFECERFDRDTGAPVGVVETRLQKLMQLLLRRASGRHAAPAMKGARQVKAMLDGVTEMQRQGNQHLRPRQLEQLIELATIGADAGEVIGSEVGCRLSANRCDQLTGIRTEEVIWWWPSEPDLPRPLAWSSVEQASLAQVGVQWRSMAARLAERSTDWTRPLLAATERFVMVLPPESEEEHPMWLLIQRICRNPPVSLIDDVRLASPKAVEIQDRPLPPLKPSMQLACDLSSRRTRQSFTALDCLIQNPAVSVLKDAAGLNGRATMRVDDEHRLMGSLAHRFVEDMFGKENVLSWSADDVGRWFSERAAQLLADEGEPLLTLGMGVTHHRFCSTVKAALAGLLEHLQAAGARGVQTEAEYETEVMGTPFSGRVDMIVELADGALAVIDLKWSKESRYVERLRSGRHLQLALYAAMVQSVTGISPVEVGYFIFEGAALLATSNEHFPTARVCAPPVRMEWESLIEQATASVRWRQQQLRGGELVLVDERVSPLTEMQGPPGSLPIVGTGPWDETYVELLGWADGA